MWAVDVELCRDRLTVLTSEEVRGIDEAAPKGATAGQRYPDMSTVNR